MREIVRTGKRLRGVLWAASWQQIGLSDIL